MRRPKEPVTRPILRHAARYLLEWIVGIYIDRVLSAEGHEPRFALPDTFIESAFASWREKLERAPARLLEPKALRVLVEEAIAEAQLRQTELFGPRLGRPHTAELLRGFGAAVDRARFVAPHGLRFRPWLAGALRLPAIPETGPTDDDVRLRERIEALTEAERTATTAWTVHECQTLRDLTPLLALPALKTLKILSGPMLVDLSPIANLTDLEELSVDTTDPADLSPIARLSGLKRLGLSADERLDLSPLRSLSALEEFTVKGCDVLSPIEDLPALTKLTFSGPHTPRSDDSIRRLVRLRALEIYGMKSDPAGVVGALRSLVILKLHSCEGLTSVSGLGGLTELEELDLSMSAVNDLSSLGALSKLRILNLFGTPIRSWPPMRDLPRLEELNAMCTDLPGFAGIEEGLALRKLDVGPSNVHAFKDLRPLSALTRMEELHLDSLEHLSDLSPLTPMKKLRVLDAGDSAIHDLAPLATIPTLDTVRLPRTPIESVAPLAELPNLRSVMFTQCWALRSIRPLAACRKLETIDCTDCEVLTGPTSVEELRAPAPAPPQAKTFPSAGPPITRPGSVTAFDARAHIPKRPPESWALPEREHDDEGLFWIEAEREARAMMALVVHGEEHVLSVHLWRHDRTRMPDKQVARILRRFRASDPFVENEETMVDESPDIRLFVARAHAASPDTWGAHRVKGPRLRVDAPEPDRTTGPTDAESDVRDHLPSPLPAGWSTRVSPKEAEDVACLITAPEAEIVALLRGADDSDSHDLYVSLMPPPNGAMKTVSDEVARALLGPFRDRGAFVERNMGPFARAPGLRIFVADVKSRKG